MRRSAAGHRGHDAAHLDTKGRLVAFAAVPPQVEAKAPPAGVMDWAPLFAAAGLDRRRCRDDTVAHAGDVRRRTARVVGHASGNADAGDD